MRRLYKSFSGTTIVNHIYIEDASCFTVVALTSTTPTSLVNLFTPQSKHSYEDAMEYSDHSKKRDIYQCLVLILYSYVLHSFWKNIQVSP